MEPKPASAGDVTQLLRRLQGGDGGAFDELFPLVYDELRRIAQRQLRRERPDHTLFATALVNEAYLKMADQREASWQDRSHFLGVAARAMRQVLVDYARRRRADKRGGDWIRTTLTNRGLGFRTSLEELIELDQALERLDQVDERLCKVVEYRFFGGLTEEETAELLGVTSRTVRRDWIKARAWLYRELYPEGTPEEAAEGRHG